MYFNAGMYYNDWVNTYGKYRWKHKDDNYRTYYPLDHNWEEIYNKVTRDADIYFNNRVIADVETFTNEFLTSVPIEWQKYKVKLEMLSGTLDGQNIDPDVFEAGFTRTTESKNANILDSKNNGTVTNDDITTLGQRSDSTTAGILSDKETKDRNISMSQGVQAYDGLINNDNIGNLGNDYADSMSDNVSLEKDNSTTDSNSTIGSQTNNSTGEVQTANETTINRDSNFTEKIHETRINYYDNLAFLRERMMWVDKIEPFHNAFKHLFKSTSAKNGWW